MKTRGLLLAAMAALAGYVFLAVQVLRSRSGEDAWLVGPSPAALMALADEKIDGAVALLNGQDDPLEERLEGFRSGLREAERYLVRSLEALPAQPRALARLAAVRYELTLGSSRDSILAMISLAARLAPDAPAIQEQMGTLLLSAGERDAAEGCLRKAVVLDPTRAGSVAFAMSEDLFTPEEILETLPRGPETLIAMERPFFEAGRVSDYADLLEQDLPGTVELLRAYGHARLWAKEGERLADAMERLGASTDSGIETERLVQLSRAHQATGDFEQAVEDAHRASKTSPEDPAVLENLGMAFLAASDPTAALAAFRDALGRLARRTGGVVDRARLYREIGVSEERRGAKDRAYDAYKRALDLDPADPVASRRVAEMETAAGLPAPENK